MRQLSNLDSTFLHLETTETPMHLTTLMVLDQSTAPGGLVTFKQILRTLDERSRAIPSYREQLVKVPLNLGNPYWSIQGKFDVEYHVRHIALPHPGDWRQLCIQTARLASRPLDSRRPLWELTVIEGLNGVEGIPPGSFALVLKQHHAAIDGASGMQILSILLDLEPDPDPVEYEEPKTEATATDSMLLARSAVDAVVRPGRAINTVVRGLPNMRRFVSELMARELSLPSIGSVPETRFGGEVSSYRVVEAVPVDMADVKAIRTAVEGATVNDVMLTIVGGAMRKYLEAHGELPEQSLVGMMPISVRGDGPATGGNQVRSATVTLGSDIEDPVQRLAAVRTATRESKQFAEALETTHLMDATEGAIPAIASVGTRLLTRVGLAAQSRRLYNTVVTNVPGPNVPVYFCGAKLIGLCGFGVLQDGSGLFHAIHGLYDRLFICVTSCREMLPDPGFYHKCLLEATEDLVASAAAQKTPIGFDEPTATEPGRPAADTSPPKKTTATKKSATAKKTATTKKSATAKKTANAKKRPAAPKRTALKT